MESSRSNGDQVIRLDSANRQLALAFLGWQCRLRQIAFRQDGGRPSDGMSPKVFVGDDCQAAGRIVSILNKAESDSVLMEFQHFYRRTRDPAQRRADVTRFLSETYFQRPQTFTDRLTTVFPPGSRVAELLESAESCRLVFEHFNQRYDLTCEAIRLREDDPLYQSTFWHNALFNPDLSKDCRILALVPNWSRCAADPAPA